MSYSTTDNPTKVRIYKVSGDDKVVVDAARVSLASLEEMNDRTSFTDRVCNERDIKLINYLAKQKHYSCFEHCSITFWIEAPIYIARQHMRHRVWSFNEVSRRYTSEDIRVYVPSNFRQQSKNNRQASTDELINPIMKSIKGTIQSYDTNATEYMEEAIKISMEAYFELLDKGVCREQARGLLPSATLTQYYATVSLRNLAAFLRERLDKSAQYEIQLMAKQMLSITEKSFPISIKALMS